MKPLKIDFDAAKKQARELRNCMTDSEELPPPLYEVERRTTVKKLLCRQF